MQQYTQSPSQARYVYDAETDGLDPTRIHVVVVGDHVCETPAELTGFMEQHPGTYYGHNSIGFDCPVLERLWSVDMGTQCVRDTLVLSRLANPSRDGGHSLDNWGEVLGYPKVVHDDWDTYTPEVLHRCKEDVKLTEKVLERLDQELEGFSEQSVELEHKVAHIINQQMNNGWQLDEEAVYLLLAELKEKKFDLEQEVHKRFKPHYKKDREIQPRYKKDGSLSTVGLKYLGDNCCDVVGGVHTRVDCVEFNLGSRKQIGEYLIRFGWVPTKFTETGQPVVSEDELRWVRDIPEAALIADYLTINQRIGMAQGWLEKVTEEGRVHGYVNSNGAVTGRMTHSDPNVAQVTAKGKPYGAEMRGCWIVPRGYKLVGMDASGLELRMLAHYMNDCEYTETVCKGRQEDGTDVHTVNQRAAGLGTRDQAKTFIYAFLYGAGDAKIGTIVGGNRAEGKRLKEKFLRGLPALKSLKERVERAAGKGYLTGLDGRRIAVRSSHAALNTLLQGAGAVVMKQALVNLERMATAQGLDYKFVGNIHDEVQAEVVEKDAERFGKLAVYAVVKAGQDLGLRCPLAADYKVGDSWMETH